MSVTGLGLARVARSLDRRFIGSRLVAILLPTWFAASSAVILWNFASHGFLFLDLIVYRHAAEQAIAGLNPWVAVPGTLAFAAPPPTVLAFLPLVFIPLPVAISGFTLILAASAVWLTRRLELPLWWVLFPPIFESIIVGNADVLVVALLLVRGPVASLSPVLKIYAFIPLIAQRRWRTAALATGLAGLSIPLWLPFLASLPEVARSLDAQSSGFSAWGTWLLVPTAIALWSLRRQGAEWLVVPGVWPDTQMHYGAMGIVVVRRYPVAAALMATQLPWAAPVAVLVVAGEAWRRRRSDPS